METMVEEPYVNHVPVMTGTSELERREGGTDSLSCIAGGVGKDNLRHFYSKHFIPCNPPDMVLVPVSLTVGTSSLVDEMVIKLTHTCEVPWLLPGVAPTGKKVEFALVAIVQFEGDKLVSEHIYWDQASVLVQIGLLDPSGLPVVGAASARKVLDKTSEPSNQLIKDF